MEVVADLLEDVVGDVVRGVAGDDVCDTRKGWAETERGQRPEDVGRRGRGRRAECSDKRRWRGSARRTLALDDDGLGDGGAGDDGTRGGRARATGGHGAAEPEAAGHPAGEEGEGDGVSARSIGRPKPRAWGGTSAMEKAHGGARADRCAARGALDVDLREGCRIPESGHGHRDGWGVRRVRLARAAVTRARSPRRATWPFSDASARSRAPVFYGLAREREAWFGGHSPRVTLRRAREACLTRRRRSTSVRRVL